jgi:hypothetical protein
MTQLKCLALGLALLLSNNLHAKLAVTINSRNVSSVKAVITVAMKNTFTNKVESARAQVFLFDAEGKVVGQGVNWVIGGTKDRPPLAPGATNTYHFVIPTEKPFSEAKVTFSRIILEGGKLADPIKDVQITK